MPKNDTNSREKRRSVVWELLVILPKLAFVFVASLSFFLTILPDDFTRSVRTHATPLESGGLLTAWSDFLVTHHVLTQEMVPHGQDDLRSKETLGRVVDEQRLTIQRSPRYFPLIGPWLAAYATALAPVPFGFQRLGHYAWGGEVIQIDELEVPPSYLGVPLTLVAFSSGTFSVKEARPFGSLDLFAGDTQTLLTGHVGEEVEREFGGGRLAIKVGALTARPGTEFILFRLDREKVITALQRALRVGEGDAFHVTLTLRDYDELDRGRAPIILQAVDEEYQRTEREHNAVLMGALLNALRPVPESQRAREEIQTRLAKITELSQTLEKKRSEAVARFGPTHGTIVAIDAKRGVLEREGDALRERLKTLPDLPISVR